MASAFHLTALPFGNEQQTMAAVQQALTEVDPGETIFFSEAVAWTASGSGVAYASLVRAARKHDVNIIATLNLGAELTEDLPGKKPDSRHHALVVFTRHSHVHVPQAKILPDAFEQRPGLEQEALPVVGYPRTNLVRFDIDEQIVEMRFFIGSDIAVITDHTPRALSCDVLVAPARLPQGAEDNLRLNLADARQAGVASTALVINGFANSAQQQRICVKLEDAADNGKPVAAKARWGSPAKLQRRLYRYTAGRRGHRSELDELERLANDDKRKGRIPVTRAPRAPKVQLGVYPVLIAM